MMMRQEEDSLKELKALQKIVSFAPFGEIMILHPFYLNAYYSALREKSLATSRDSSRRPPVCRRTGM
jgi:hypothetical protein